MVFAYSKMGRVIALDVETINSFCLPHLVEVSAFKMLRVCFGLVMVHLYVVKMLVFGRVIPKIFECFVVGRRRRLERYPLQVRHQQDWGRGFILLLPQTAVLPGSDANSDVAKPASGFVIQNRQTSCSMWCPMYRARC